MAQIEQTGPAVPSALEADAPQGPIGNFRWVICGLLFFATAINYIDRQTLSILKTPLSHDLHWSQQDYANIHFGGLGAVPDALRGVSAVVA